MRATGMSVLRQRATRSSTPWGDGAPGLEPVGDVPFLMLFTLGLQRKGGQVRRKEFGTAEVTRHLRQEELVRPVEGLGVHDGAADHPDVLARMPRTELGEARHDAETLP